MEVEVGVEVGYANEVSKASISSGGCRTPSSFKNGLLGHQSQPPPASLVVPPTIFGDASQMTTESEGLARFAAMAAEHPAAPLPATSTSTVSSQLLIFSKWTLLFLERSRASGDGERGCAALRSCCAASASRVFNCGGPSQGVGTIGPLLSSPLLVATTFRSEVVCAGFGVGIGCAWCAARNAAQ